jgi:hypothetical protein
MLTLKDLSMGIKVIGILYVFYLQYTNMVSIPMSIVVLIALGSLGSALACKSKMNEGYFYHRYYNYAVALAGVVVIMKEYM